MNTVRYTALFVNDKEKLLSMFPPRHKNIVAHHSTIDFMPKDLEKVEVGKKSLLKIVGQAYDKNCFALLVENNKSANKFPHITISHSDNVTRVYSNDLLEKASQEGVIEVFTEPVFIEVIEGYADTEGNVFVGDIHK